MTLLNAPWALDGATISSALARRGQYAAMSGGEGIVNAADLKVSQLAVPGNGLLISAGNAAITNRYQTDPNETYIVANPGTHTILSTSMPTSQPSAKSYLVLVTVGDPEFSQVGHPWMTSDVLDPEVAPGYDYVRPWLLEVPAGTTSFEDLGLHYPAYALARVDIPATTTTITNAMITDLRAMARPRTLELLFNAVSGAGSMLAATNVYEDFPPNSSYSVKIPKWATKAGVIGWLSAIVIQGAPLSAYGDFRLTIVGAGSTPVTTFDDMSQGGSTDWTRYGYNVGGVVAIPAGVRGTTQVVKFETRGYNAPVWSTLKSDDRTTNFIRVRFEESPV